jgi:hypothetical protein
MKTDKRLIIPMVLGAFLMSGCESGKAIASLEDNTKGTVPLNGQTTAKTVTAGSTSAWDSSTEGEFFSKIFKTDGTFMYAIKMAQFYANDIYCDYGIGTDVSTPALQSAATCTPKNFMTSCGMGAVAVTGDVTLPYFTSDTISGIDCKKDYTSIYASLPEGHDEMNNYYSYNDVAGDITFLHSKIKDTENSGKYYTMLAGKYSDSTKDFDLKMAELDDKLTANDTFDDGEWAIAAKISGNVGTHLSTIQLSADGMQVAGKGVSEGGYYLMKFKSTSGETSYCIDTSKETKVAVDATNCSDYTAAVDAMEYIDPVTTKFSVTPQ